MVRAGAASTFSCTAACLPFLPPSFLPVCLPAASPQGQQEVKGRRLLLLPLPLLLRLLRILLLVIDSLAASVPPAAASSLLSPSLPS